ncbi:HTH-type transcriptional regulator UlaR [Streptomyces violaceorubidus]
MIVPARYSELSSTIKQSGEECGALGSAGIEERRRGCRATPAWKALLELLVEQGRLDVEEAATELEVSAATIRRDFDRLAEQQMLVRTRGGAVVHGVSYELPLRYKTARRASEKQRVAQAVAALVAPGEAVGLTGGTTTTEVARALAVRTDLALGHARADRGHQRAQHRQRGWPSGRSSRSW